MKYKTYPKMKDSEIEWVGKIPEHWEVNSIRHLGKIETSGIDKKIQKNENLVNLVNYLDIYKNETKIIDKNTNFTQTSCTQEQLIRNKLLEGDVLFTPSSETINEIGFSAVVDHNLDNSVFSYVPKTDQMDSNGWI